MRTVIVCALSAALTGRPVNNAAAAVPPNKPVNFLRLSDIFALPAVMNSPLNLTCKMRARTHLACCAAAGAVSSTELEEEEITMALVPLAQRGNFIHVYDFRVKPGKGEEFTRLFDEFDYSDANPMHKSAAQAKDGVLCRDTTDPDHF